MAEQIIDIRERIEKMRIKMDEEQNLDFQQNEIHQKDNTLNENDFNKTEKIKYNNNEIENKKSHDNNDISKNITNVDVEKPFPSVSLSVKNPISTKTLVILMRLSR